MQSRLHTRRLSLKLFTAGLLALGGASLPQIAAAQDYPNRPIQIVVPYPPGGTAGLMGHLMAPKLSELLGQPVVIDQRPGAATRVGTTYVAKSAPDGYTLLLVSEAPFTLLPHSGPKLQYDPLKDFAPISMVSRSSPMLVVNPKFPANNVKEFIEVLKKEPKKHFYASSGIGGTNHLAAELFQQMAGVQMVHVPFSGTGAGIPALLGNQVDVMFGFMNAVASYVREGTVKALATGSAQRLAAMPDVPTISEAGVPGYEFTSWFGLFAPAGTPPAIIAKLNGALLTVMKDTGVREKLMGDGAELVGSTPEFLMQQIKTDYVKNEKMKQFFEQKPEAPPAAATAAAPAPAK